MSPLVIQCIGFVGLLLCSTSGLWRTTHQILVSSLCGLVFFVTHYCLLGAISGAMTDATSLMRAIAALYCPTLTMKTLFFAMPLVILSSQGLSVANGMVCIGAMISTKAAFHRSAQGMRYYNILSTPFWLYYNISNHSYPGLSGDLLGCAINLLALRLYARQEKHLQ